MYWVLVASFVIIIIVTLLAVITTSKAYSFKHTVDPLEDNQHANDENLEKDKEKVQ